MSAFLEIFSYAVLIVTALCQYTRSFIYGRPLAVVYEFILLDVSRHSALQLNIKNIYGFQNLVITATTHLVDFDDIERSFNVPFSFSILCYVFSLFNSCMESILLTTIYLNFKLNFLVADIFQSTSFNSTLIFNN